MKHWKKIAGDIWECNDEIRMPGGIYFSIRSVAVRLASGDIWLHSPCNFNSDAIAELKTLGPVRYIIAPNTYHHMYVEKAAVAFPKAQIWCAPGVSKKQKTLKIDAQLSRKTPWSEEIETLPIGGVPALNESVFFHHASKSFICTDYVFNIHTFKNLRTKFLISLAGANRKFAQSLTWRFISKDRSVLIENSTEILSWDFERVVMGHGQILDTPDVHAQMLKATAWQRKGERLEKRSS